MSLYLSEGIALSNLWFCPARVLQNQLGHYYQTHPVMSRVIAVPLGVILGFIEPFLFPLASLVGIVALPLIGLARGSYREGLVAGALSALAFSATLLFMSVSAFRLPLVVTSTLFTGGIALSITFHVHQAIKGLH